MERDSSQLLKITDLNRLLHADILQERERFHSEQEMRCELMKSGNAVLFASAVHRIRFSLLVTACIWFKFHTIRMSNH